MIQEPSVSQFKMFPFNTLENQAMITEISYLQYEMNPALKRYTAEVKEKDEAVASKPTRRKDKCLGPENRWELRQSNVFMELALKVCSACPKAKGAETYKTLVKDKEDVSACNQFCASRREAKSPRFGSQATVKTVPDRPLDSQRRQAVVTHGHGAQPLLTPLRAEVSWQEEE
ncbi:hypothetical protein llap_5054 [Limosa lapponica baueri]|uniref:Uncharacterized protein n=1 Tax=Limosa lapponica baueri TaxID=1758121 RepID=A0A2I0UEZ3_LIMLA|nr:hypothetical protein llap_5054 [Limosa lapponica baueri]